MMCLELQRALEKTPIFFDVPGGCGIDLSLGKNPCMGATGIWFKFCPFCGKKITSKYNGDCWEWEEE